MLRCFRLTRHQLLITIGFLLHMYNNLAYRFIDSFVPVYAAEAGASQFEVGLIFSAFCLAIFLLSPLWGSLCIQHGYKAIILLGLCIEGTALCFLSFTQQLTSAAFIATMIILRVVEGVGSAATQTGCYSMLAAESGDEGEGAGTGMGGMEMFGGVGNMLGPIIGAWLADSYGFSVPFIAIGILGLSSAAMTSVVLPKKQQLIDEVDLDFIAKNTLPISGQASAAPSEPPSPSASSTLPSSSSSFSYTVPPSPSNPRLQESASGSSRADIPTSIRALVGDTAQPDNVASPPPVYLRDVLAVPSVTYSALVAIVALACMSFLSATLEIFFHDEFGLSNLQIGMSLALASFVQLLSCAPAGWVSDRYATKLPMFIGLSLLSVSLLLLGPSPFLPIPPMIGLQVASLCILGCGVSLAVIPTFVDQIKSSAHLGTASQAVIAGLSASSFSLGEVIGPFLGSSLVSAWSFQGASTLLAFACMTVLALGAVGVWCRIIPFDAGKEREAMMRKAKEEQSDASREGIVSHSSSQNGHYAAGNGVNGHAAGGGHGSSVSTPNGRKAKRPGKVTHMVEMIAHTVNAERRRRAGYEEAVSIPPSPSSSPDSQSQHSASTSSARYSPNASYILNLEDSEDYEGETQQDTAAGTAGREGEQEEKRTAATDRAGTLRRTAVSTRRAEPGLELRGLSITDEELAREAAGGEEAELEDIEVMDDAVENFYELDDAGDLEDGLDRDSDGRSSRSPDDSRR